MSMIVGGLVVVLIIFGIAFTFTTADQQHRGTPIEAGVERTNGTPVTSGPIK
jgi:hypothetical protein